MLAVEQKKTLQSMFRDYTLKDIQVSNCEITDSNREQIVFDTINYLQRFESVVTDRFHACVFAYLTKTPCFAVQEKIPHKNTVYPLLDYPAYFKSFRSLIFAQKQHSPLLPKKGLSLIHI